MHAQMWQHPLLVKNLLSPSFSATLLSH